MRWLRPVFLMLVLALVLAYLLRPLGRCDFIFHLPDAIFSKRKGPAHSGGPLSYTYVLLFVVGFVTGLLFAAVGLLLRKALGDPMALLIDLCTYVRPNSLRPRLETRQATFASVALRGALSVSPCWSGACFSSRPYPGALRNRIKNSRTEHTMKRIALFALVSIGLHSPG